MRKQYGHTQIGGVKMGLLKNFMIGFWVGKGESVLALHMYEEAIDYFDRALMIDPRNIDAWILKGKALNALSRDEEAEECYYNAIKSGFNPEDINEE